jgi:MFS family permease
MVNGLQLLPEWQNSFHHPVGSTLGLLGAIQNIGSLGSIPVAPLWNDRFGRRLTVMLGGSLMLTGAVLQATSKNIGWFMGGRALLGFGGGFNNNADPLMVIELCYPSQRPPIAGAYNSFVNVGSIIAAATTFGTYYITNSEWSWRLPVLIQIVPTAIQWSIIMFGPESPRWLIGKGKDQQALKILAKYHGGGDPNHPLVIYEYEEMRKAIAEEHDNKVGWTHLFKTPGMRKRSFTMMVLAVSGQWSGNAMISYYLNQVSFQVTLHATSTSSCRRSLRPLA